MLAISSIIRLLITITYLNVSDSSASNICKPLKRLINSIWLFIYTRISSVVNHLHHSVSPSYILCRS